MIALPETMAAATELNVRGENIVWKKPKSSGNNKAGDFNMIEHNEKRNSNRMRGGHK